MRRNFVSGGHAIRDMDRVDHPSRSGASFHAVLWRSGKIAGHCYYLGSRACCVRHEALWHIRRNLTSDVVKVGLIERYGASWVKIAFTDNGLGVSDDIKGHIFENFFTRRHHGEAGMGLGLTSVKKAAEAHGGRVYLESSGTEGTCISFEFPADGQR